MEIYRTNNPLEYTQVEGIVIDETVPAPQVQGVGTGVAILAGQFAWGEEGKLVTIGKNQLHKLFMQSSYSGNIALLNKSFAALKVVRVVAADAVKASLTVQDVIPKDSIVLTAKYKGVKGNSIKVTVEDGTSAGKKWTVRLDDSANVDNFPAEVYDNVAFADLPAAMATSKLVVASLAAGADTEVENIAETALSLGSDGTIADTDYETAIKAAEAERAGNVIFLDEYNATRNGYLVLSVGTTQDKMCIVGFGEEDDVATVVAALTALNPSDRVVAAYNWVETLVSGVKTFVQPASFLASIFSQVGPHISLADKANERFLYGVTALKRQLTRADYITLRDGGLCSLEYDPDYGFALRSAIEADGGNISRRRMADFLTESFGRYLKNYASKVNSTARRQNIAAGYLNFVENVLEKDGVLPSDSEVSDGLAKIVDVESLNDNDSIAAGKVYILYKQRIWSHMDFIILKAEIGESVVVTVS